MTPRPIPRAWPTVVRLALAARPAAGLRGLLALLRRKRVRGWTILANAAAAHPGCYAAWIDRAEPALLPAPVPSRSLSIGALLIGGDDAATRQSLRRAFGPDMPVFVDTLPVERPTWLLPIRSGDRVAPALGAVLADRLADCAAPLAYWDEDRWDGAARTTPWIKPDWDPVLFGAVNGLTSACVVRGDGLDLADLTTGEALARLAVEGARPCHIPLILTHRAQARRASVRVAPPAPPVSVSVIVPTRDRAELLETCLAGLVATRFPGPHEIIVVDNDSHEPETLALFDRVTADGTARVLRHPGSFNFAAMNNAAAAVATGELLCLLNNDIEMRDPDWLLPMVPLALDPRTGAVGAQLRYPDGTIQHAGVALGIGGAAGHVDKGVTPAPGAFTPWHAETRTVSAVTAACLVVRADRFARVGGMDADTFAVDFNDVDLCLRLGARGWRTIYCAEAVLVHHESKSRGIGHVGAARVRFDRELAALRARWGTQSTLDPYHSPLFRRQSERCLLAF